MCYSQILKRINMKPLALNDQWKKIEFPVTLPIGEEKQYLQFVLFFWQQPEAKAEIRNLKIETL